MTDPGILLVQALTLTVASVGAVLGIINTWHGLDKSRVKLKVSPAQAIPVGDIDSKLRFCIEVTNLRPPVLFDALCYRTA
jgi:hypothetical protein